jgi:hypothetical protein
MRLLSRTAVLAASLPLLAGCFDMSQSLTVDANRTVTYVTEMAMTADMMAFAEEGEEQEEFCPTEFEDIPPGFTATAEESTRENGDAVCTVTAIGPLDQLQAAIASGKFIPGGMEDDAPAITLVDEGGGVFLYTLTLAIDPEEPPTTPLTAEEMAFQTQMETMVLQAMEGRMLTWSITAPRIISTTGELVGNTATFSLPLTISMTAPGTTHTFEVRFAL